MNITLLLTNKNYLVEEDGIYISDELGLLQELTDPTHIAQIETILSNIVSTSTLEANTKYLYSSTTVPFTEATGERNANIFILRKDPSYITFIESTFGIPFYNDLLGTIPEKNTNSGHTNTDIDNMNTHLESLCTYIDTNSL